jgi:hypothetical protein
VKRERPFRIDPKNKSEGQYPNSNAGTLVIILIVMGIILIVFGLIA